LRSVDILAHFSQFGAIDFATIAMPRDHQIKKQEQVIKEQIRQKQAAAATAGGVGGSGGSNSGVAVINRYNSTAPYVMIFYDNT
jgi:hypothetical protein